MSHEEREARTSFEHAAAGVIAMPTLGVAVTDVERGVILEANEAFLSMTGRTAEEVASGAVTIASITAPTSRAVTEAAVDAARRAEPLAPFEKDFLRPDGSMVRVWLSWVRIPGPGARTLTVAVDISDRETTVQALKQSEERSRRFAEASFEGLFIHDSGVIIDVNEPLVAMYRTTREHMVGRTAFDFAAPESHDLLRRNVANRYLLPYEAIGMRPDGSRFPIEVLGRSLPLSGERMRVTAVRDVTERKRTDDALRQAEAALLQAQKLESLGLLAGGIAHDFNNLLSVILGAAAIAMRRLPEGSNARQAIQDIESAATRASDLTRQMLVYSGRSPKQVGALRLNEVVSEIANLLAASFSKKTEVEIDLTPSLPPLRADRAQIQQVVMNLVGNAADAIGDARGSIRVATQVAQVAEGTVPAAGADGFVEPGSYAVIEVSDTGAGMAPEVLARIFDPFFTTKAKGRGLGLSAMLGILRGHRAGLRVESTPGAGTLFRVYLPIVTMRPTDRPAASIPPPLAMERDGAILVVDDEPGLRRTTRMVLELHGYRVLEATDGVDALAVYRRHTPDIALVLLDLMMPELDGRETLRAIRDLDPHVRVVLTSGFDANEVLEGFRSTVSGFLPKPYREADLLGIVAPLVRPRT